MKFYIPIYVLVEAPDPQDAERQRVAVQLLLNNGYIGATLKGSGINYEKLVVADPVVAQIIPNGNYNNG